MLAYLAKEGDPEVGAEVPLPCSHNVYHLSEGSVQLAIHLCHVLWRGKRERGGEIKEGRGEERRRGEGRRVGQSLEEWSKKEADKKKDLAAFYPAPFAYIVKYFYLNNNVHLYRKVIN